MATRLTKVLVREIEDSLRPGGPPLMFKFLPGLEPYIEIREKGHRKPLGQITFAAVAWMAVKKEAERLKAERAQRRKRRA